MWDRPLGVPAHNIKHLYAADRPSSESQVKAVPYTPLSHPFIERLIGTIRREFLDHTLFWNAVDLDRKLASFQMYFNHHRAHSSLGSDTPAEVARGARKLQTTLKSFSLADSLPWTLSASRSGLIINSPCTGFLYREIQP
jgi:hypothetical protein